jgi:hypothetical protein
VARVSIKPEVLDAMVAAGASAEVIAAAVKADLAQDEERKAARRIKNAERQRRHRASRSVTRDTALQRVTARDTPPEVSPEDNNQTPFLPSPVMTEEAREPHRLPRDFRLSETAKDFARQHGWSDGEITDGEAEFIDYWSNPKLPASKALKLDWEAVWRNRVRDLGKRRGMNGRAQPNTNGFHHGTFRQAPEPRKPSVLDVAKRRLAELEQREREDAGVDGPQGGYRDLRLISQA